MDIEKQIKVLEIYMTISLEITLMIYVVHCPKIQINSLGQSFTVFCN